MVPAIARDPWLDSLRGDAGFAAVLRARLKPGTAAPSSHSHTPVETACSG